MQAAWATIALATQAELQQMGTCELQHSVEARSVLRAGLSHAGGPLQVSLHLVLNLQLAHAAPRLQVVEVYQLIWLSMCVRVLQAVIKILQHCMTCLWVNTNFAGVLARSPCKPLRYFGIIWVLLTLVESCIRQSYNLSRHDQILMG